MSNTAELTAAELESLADEIATFAARIDVAEHALLTRLRTFDAHEAWGPLGFLSCAQWLSWRIGIGIKAAREKVRVARALGTLPKIDALFSRGQLSYSKVRAITRVATPENEQDFVDAGLYATASQIERLTRAFRRSVAEPRDPRDCQDLREQLRHQQRFVRRTDTLGGMVRIEMQLPPEEAALVWDTLMSAMDASPGASAEASAEAGPAPEPAANDVRPSPEAPAEACAETSAEASPEHAPDTEQRRADAIVDIARAYLQHRPRTLGSGYELVVVTTKEQLEHGPGGVGGYLRDGTPIPLHVARMLACDAAQVDVTLGPDGELLDVGRRRSIPPAISRALWLRDGGCRVPGCGRKHHVHAHHIQPWAEGGPTRLSNLVLVCPGHHRLIHEQALNVGIDAGKITFVDRSGRAIPASPPSAATGRDLDELERFLHEVELHLDPSTIAPKWDGRPMKLADTLEWMFIAEQTRARPSAATG